MSTHIKDIWEIGICRFVNKGEDKIQLTPMWRKDYSRLNKKEVEVLIRTLEHVFDREVYPSE